MPKTIERYFFYLFIVTYVNFIHFYEHTINYFLNPQKKTFLKRKFVPLPIKVKNPGTEDPPMVIPKGDLLC